jgi:hypothetical protein
MKLTNITTSMVFLATSEGFASPIQAPTPQQFYYTSSGKRADVNSSMPIMFNGIPIHTQELSSEAPHETIHSINDGHHFFHKGWTLLAKNGGTWEYQPPIWDSMITSHNTPPPTKDTHYPIRNASLGSPRQSTSTGPTRDTEPSSINSSTPPPRHCSTSFAMLMSPGHRMNPRVLLSRGTGLLIRLVLHST